MELQKFWNIDECLDREKLFSKLDLLVGDGKIEWSVDGEILKIEDLDLEEVDIETLTKLFDKLDVFVYGYDDEDEDDTFDEEDEEY